MVARMAHDARADFEHWDRVGRVRPIVPRPVAQLCVPVQARRGKPVLVEWSCRAAASATLMIESPDTPARIISQGRVRGAIMLDQLGSGHHQFVLTAAPHRQLGPRAVGATIRAALEIVVPEPEIRLLVSADGEVGRDLSIRWEIYHAEQAWLTVGEEARIVDLAGDCLVVPDRAGPLEITMAALGEGGRTQAHRQIHVEMPRLSIDAPVKVAAMLGSGAVIAYRIWGAVSGSTHLVARDRVGEDQSIPAIGTIAIDDIIGDEALCLVATGHDGVTREHVIELRAALPQVDIDEELDFLAQRRTKP